MNRKRLATFWEQYGTLCILVLIIVVFSGLSSDFMKPENIVHIFVQSAITILVALGEFFAILIAGIDLSVGSIVAITGILTAKLMVAGLHPILAVLVGGIGVGIVLGALQRYVGEFHGPAPLHHHPGYQCDFPWLDLYHLGGESGLWVPL
jgi:Ribose/xylose/arabinose/galactoside ABC-type transport systems, permease components